MKTIVTVFFIIIFCTPVLGQTHDSLSKISKSSDFVLQQKKDTINIVVSEKIKENDQSTWNWDLIISAFFSGLFVTVATMYASKLTREGLKETLATNTAIEEGKRKHEVEFKQKNELKSLFSQFFTIGHFLNSKFSHIHQYYLEDEYAHADDPDKYALVTYHEEIAKYVNDFINITYTIRLTLNDTEDQVKIEKLLGVYTNLVQGAPDFLLSDPAKVQHAFGNLFDLVKKVVN